MIMQRIEFDGQDDLLTNPHAVAEQPGLLYGFVPQNVKSMQFRIDNAETRERLIQRKAEHDLLKEAHEFSADELYFG